MPADKRRSGRVAEGEANFERVVDDLVAHPHSSALAIGRRLGLAQQTVLNHLHEAEPVGARLLCRGRHAKWEMG